MANDDLRLVAAVGGPHGLGGAVRLRPVDEPERLLGLSRLYLEGHGWRAVRSAELHVRVPVVTLEGVASREAAEALAGAPVYAEDAALLLEEGHHYYSDLVGRPVRSPDGVALGVVRDIMDAGAQDLLVVARGNRDFLVPLQADYVKVLEDGIEVEPIPGLLDDDLA